MRILSILLLTPHTYRQAFIPVCSEQFLKYKGGTGSIKEMMDKFREYHDPVKDYLFSGIGLELQNQDSIIMEKILMRLHNKGICGLPVHDSVIVKKEHYRLLYQIMMEEYENVMGFVPVLK